MIIVSQYTWFLRLNSYYLSLQHHLPQELPVLIKCRIRSFIWSGSLCQEHSRSEYKFLIKSYSVHGMVQGFRGLGFWVEVWGCENRLNLVSQIYPNFIPMKSLLIIWDLRLRPAASPSCKLYLRAGSRRGHNGLRPEGFWICGIDRLFQLKRQSEASGS